jgi:hypothetical protein
LLPILGKILARIQIKISVLTQVTSKASLQGDAAVHYSTTTPTVEHLTQLVFWIVAEDISPLKVTQLGFLYLESMNWVEGQGH